MDHFEAKLSEATAGYIVPGVFVAAVDRTGKPVYTYSSGCHSLSKDATPISPDSIFVIASCTKLVTAVAALQCVDRGLISLDDPVSQHLPELDAQEIISMHPPTSPDPVQGLADGTGTEAFGPHFTYSPAKTKITLRHLLTHTGGLGADYMNPLLAWRKSRGEPCMVMHGDILASFTMPRLCEPGTSWAYSGGLDWAGLLVGRLNKMTFGQYLEESVFMPLGMRDSTFHLEDRPDVRARIVEMILRREDRSLVPGKHELSDPVKDELGGGGLYTSGTDFAKLLGDLLKHKPVTLKRETVALLFSPQLEAGGDGHQALMTYERFWNSFIPCPPQSLNWAVGGLLVMEDDPSAGIPKGTLTWSGSSGPMWAINREKGFAWFYATQISYGDTESGELCQHFSKLIFAGKGGL